jgi:hypothetical protein
MHGGGIWNGRLPGKRLNGERTKQDEDEQEGISNNIHKVV